MKKLSDYIGQKIAVNCTTPEQAEAFCKLMHENWLKWFSRESYLETTRWDRHQENTCYDYNNGSYTDKDYFIHQGYTILPSTDFLEEEYVYGQEYEFSDDEDFKNSGIYIFGCKNPTEKYGYRYICFTKNGFPYNFKYCRKINTERYEAITTAKELIAKFDIKQEELFN